MAGSAATAAVDSRHQSVLAPQGGRQMAVVSPVSVPTGALREFEALLGSERVLTSQPDLDEWRDPFQHPSWDEYTASAVLMPETVEEVQGVVRIANRAGVPLWTHSQGRNNGYGG